MTHVRCIPYRGPVGVYALVGSVAMLSGIVRVSFSIVVIAAEATGSCKRFAVFIRNTSQRGPCFAMGNSVER